MRSRSKLEAVLESQPSTAVFGRKPLSFFSVRNSLWSQDILLPSYRSPGKTGRSFLFVGDPTISFGEFGFKKKLCGSSHILPKPNVLVRAIRNIIRMSSHIFEIGGICGGSRKSDRKQSLRGSSHKTANPRKNSHKNSPNPAFVSDIILLFSHRYLTFREILDTKRYSYGL